MLNSPLFVAALWNADVTRSVRADRRRVMPHFATTMPTPPMARHAAHRLRDVDALNQR
jgi:hypothetical protein